MNTSKKLLIGFVTLGLVVASAASEYKVDLGQAVQLGGTELKPGKYKVTIEGDKAVFKSGKEVVAQVPATVQTGTQTYINTMLSTTADSKLTEIAVGGTKVKIVLKP